MIFKFRQILFIFVLIVGSILGDAIFLGISSVRITPFFARTESQNNNRIIDRSNSNRTFSRAYGWATNDRHALRIIFCATNQTDVSIPSMDGQRAALLLI